MRPPAIPIPIPGDYRLQLRLRPENCSERLDGRMVECEATLVKDGQLPSLGEIKAYIVYRDEFDGDGGALWRDMDNADHELIHGGITFLDFDGGGCIKQEMKQPPFNIPPSCDEGPLINIQEVVINDELRGGDRNIGMYMVKAMLSVLDWTFAFVQPGALNLSPLVGDGCERPDLGAEARALRHKKIAHQFERAGFKSSEGAYDFNGAYWWLAQDDGVWQRALAPKKRQSIGSTAQPAGSMESTKDPQRARKRARQTQTATSR